ncbi:unnamed protein product [Symbiodinium natans]|uniref:Uncharacterized protein n=1 Tax=Symbiodinium natans TaxID=878477 RepID=A0A812NQZ3_9DINO|nr:unnamed protein product [Symbiodinium natans]
MTDSTESFIFTLAKPSQPAVVQAKRDIVKDQVVECKFKGEWLEATVLEVSTWSADSDDEDETDGRTVKVRFARDGTESTVLAPNVREHLDPEEAQERERQAQRAAAKELIIISPQADKRREATLLLAATLEAKFPGSFNAGELEAPDGIAVSALAGDMSALSGKDGPDLLRRLGTAAHCALVPGENSVYLAGTTPLDCTRGESFVRPFLTDPNLVTSGASTEPQVATEVDSIEDMYVSNLYIAKDKQKNLPARVLSTVADKHGVVAFFDDAATLGVEDSVRLNVLCWEPERRHSAMEMVKELQDTEPPPEEEPWQAEEQKEEDQNESWNDDKKRKWEDEGNESWDNKKKKDDWSGDKGSWGGDQKKDWNDKSWDKGNSGGGWEKEKKNDWDNKASSSWENGNSGKRKWDSQESGNDKWSKDQGAKSWEKQDWKSGGKDDWKSGGGKEDWKSGGKDDWKSGGKDDWKSGGKDDWKSAGKDDWKSAGKDDWKSAGKDDWKSGGKDDWKSAGKDDWKSGGKDDWKNNQAHGKDDWGQKKQEWGKQDNWNKKDDWGGGQKQQDNWNKKDDWSGGGGGQKQDWKKDQGGGNQNQSWQKQQDWKQGGGGGGGGGGQWGNNDQTSAWGGGGGNKKQPTWQAPAQEASWGGGQQGDGGWGTSSSSGSQRWPQEQKRQAPTWQSHEDNKRQRSDAGSGYGASQNDQRQRPVTAYSAPWRGAGRPAPAREEYVNVHADSRGRQRPDEILAQMGKQPDSIDDWKNVQHIVFPGAEALPRNWIRVWSKKHGCEYYLRLEDNHATFEISDVFA